MRTFLPTAVHQRRGFSLVELTMVLLILSIVSLIAVDSAANADAPLRAERAAREAAAAIRFARMRAWTDGTSYKVRFNIAAQTISVIDPANGNAVLAAPMAGDIMQINLSGKSDISGVAMAAAIVGSSSDPYDVTYSALGGTTNTGTITFTYGPITKVLQIGNVGDPIMVGDTRQP